jgi:hypothetical protein
MILLEGQQTWVPAYGAYYAKILSRVRDNAGIWVLQNAENLMYFAMSSYYASLEGYPSRPFAVDRPVGNPQARSYSTFYFENNTLHIQNRSDFSASAYTIPPASSTCGLDTDESSATITFVETSATFAADADYPATYQSSLNSWRSTWSAYWATAEAASPTTSPGLSPASSTAAPSPACHSLPTGLTSPPQASASAAVEAFCQDSRIAGKVLSNETPYVDLPYAAEGVKDLLQLMVSWGAQNCGGWATLDTSTCKSMLTNVLETCKGAPGNVTTNCVVYSYDITESEKPDPSIPEEYIDRGEFSCVDT